MPLSHIPGPGKLNSETLLGDTKGTAALGDSLIVLWNLKTELPWDSVMPLLGTHPKEVKAAAQTDTWTSRLTAAWFPTVNGRNHARVRGSKLWSSPAREYYSAFKRKFQHMVQVR